MTAIAVAGTTGDAAAGTINAHRPLIVVVEAAPGTGCGAADVRQAIENELGAAVIAPSQSPVPTSADMLIVSLDRRQIVMSMRVPNDEMVWRAVPAPREPAARLRAVAWLAGNLARDQVSPIIQAAVERQADSSTTAVLAQPLPSSQAPLSAPASPTSPAAAAKQEETASSSPTQPPPLPAPTLADAQAGVTRSFVIASIDAQAPRWAVTVAGGPTATLIYGESLGRSILVYRSGWQVELQRVVPATGNIMGVALDGGPEEIGHLLGAAAFTGYQWRMHRWTFEAAGGAGIQASRTRVVNTTISNNSVTGSQSMTVVTGGIRPALYTRGAVGIGTSMTRSLDLFVRLGGQLNTTGFRSHFFSSTVGLRYRLP